MSTLTKTLMMTLTLTLAGACDVEDADFGDGEVALRPGGGGFSGISLNTDFFTDGVGFHGMSVAEIDTKGNLHKGVDLYKVCLMGGEVCIFPGKDELYVKQGEIHAIKGGGMSFSGTDFANSEWYVQLDSDGDDKIDSYGVMVIQEAYIGMTATGIKYWNYMWLNDTSRAKGLITQKWEGKGGESIPVCKIDVDTGSLGSVALGNVTIDNSEFTHGDIDHRDDTLYIACHSGAVGKAPHVWNYVHHDLGDKAYETAVRVIRADYCNDGTSFTQEGQQLLTDDDKAYNSAYNPAEDTELLASWDKGIVCVNPKGLRLAKIEDVEEVCEVKYCDGSDTWWGAGLDLMTQAL
ncbi:MAG: hypothetical protein H6710_18670 [Myxococcales bacterium]|nr:hypothetical protein [Myxococcales bacterium]